MVISFQETFEEKVKIMTDAASDGAKEDLTPQAALEVKIAKLKDRYMFWLERFLEHNLNGKSKERFRSKRELFKAARDWDHYSRGSEAKSLSMTLKALVTGNEQVWADLLCAIANEDGNRARFRDFKRLSPFKNKRATVLRCNGDYLLIRAGDLRDEIERMLPENPKALSLHLLIMPKIRKSQLISAK
jgi:hypothetical protein